MKMTTSVFMKERRYSTIKDKIRENKKIIFLAIMIILIIVIDQVTKFAIVKNIYASSLTVLEEIMNFTYVENRGGAYGIGNDSTLMFIIVNAIVITLITKFILSKKNDISTYILVSLGLILAGGIGNLIDRIFRGFVVDFLDFNPLIKFPVFNIADICIVLGCVLVIISFIHNAVKSRGDK